MLFFFFLYCSLCLWNLVTVHMSLILRTNSPLQSVCNDVNSIKYCILDVTMKDMEIQFYLQKTISSNLLHSWCSLYGLEEAKPLEVEKPTVNIQGKIYYSFKQGIICWLTLYLINICKLLFITWIFDFLKWFVLQRIIIACFLQLLPSM